LGAPRARDRGLRRRRHVASVRVPLQAGRSRPGAAVRRAAPAARRLSGLVPVPRARGRALVRAPPRPTPPSAGRGPAAVRRRPVPRRAAALRPRRRLPLPLHRRRDTRGDRRLVAPRAPRLPADALVPLTAADGLA